MFNYSDFIFAPITSNAWALSNLMLVTIGIFLAVFALIDHIGGKRRKKREERIDVYTKAHKNAKIAVEEKHIRQNNLDWLIIVEFLGFTSVVIFLLTQNINNIMVLMNWMTIAHIILFVVELVALRFVYIGKHNEEN